MERFADEVRAVAGLDHPGIVTSLTMGAPRRTRGRNARSVADSPWLAMERITGGTAAPKTGGAHACITAILEALGSAHGILRDQTG